MVAVVLSMHRSGSSLLASILLSLGVHMGESLLMRGKNQPYGHWEDRDFLRLNEAILRAAGGRWNRPPSHGTILKVRAQVSTQIKNLIEKKNKRKRWGWKDPRTSLTISLFQPYLVSPRYIRIIRQKAQVLQSLQDRHKTTRGWGALHDTYIQRVDDFLVEKPHLVVTYEALMKSGEAEIERINAWVGGNGRIEVAMERIRHD